MAGKCEPVAADAVHNVDAEVHILSLCGMAKALISKSGDDIGGGIGTPWGPQSALFDRLLIYILTKRKFSFGSH